ncbi:MAG: type II toxin-antitoxin system VapC family toxin [Acidobacteria bacterium]|nr:type II toxin-antitoxin system VapC family toxin [Acidobacteriota bacterium]
MKYLLDTHAFIWFVENDPRLSPTARLLIEDSTNELWLSIASVWEMAIKVNLNKLSLGMPFRQAITLRTSQNNILILGIEVKHTFQVADFPLHHRDPFDRIIAAQSLTENLPLISIDAAFDPYGVQRVW